MEDLIPGSMINTILREHIPQNMKISIKYKRTLKKMVYLYINYIMTVAETLAEEKGMRRVDSSILKEALEALEFYQILKNIEKYEKEKILNKSKAKKNKKRNVSDLRAS